MHRFFNATHVFRLGEKFGRIGSGVALGAARFHGFDVSSRADRPGWTTFARGSRTASGTRSSSRAWSANGDASAFHQND